MPKIFGQVSRTIPEPQDKNVFKDAIRSGGKDVRVVFDPKTGNVGTESRQGFWASKTVRTIATAIGSVFLALPGALMYLGFSAKAEQIKKTNQQTVDRFLATMQKAYGGEGPDPRLEELNRQVRSELRGGRSLTPDHAQHIVHRFKAIARERVAHERPLEVPQGGGPPDRPPPEQPRVSIEVPQVDVPQVDPRVREQEVRTLTALGLDKARAGWGDYAREQRWPEGIAPTPANLQQIHEMALAKFKEANARDARPEDLREGTFSDLVKLAIVDFVAQQREGIRTGEYSPDLEVGYQLERRDAMSGLDAPDKAQKMFGLLKCGRAPTDGLLELMEVPARDKVDENVRALGLMPPPLPGLEERLKNSHEERAKCKRDMIDLGKALAQVNDQRAELALIRSLVNRDHAGDKGDKELLSAFNPQIDRQIARLDEAIEAGRQKLFAYIDKTHEYIALPTEAFDAAIGPLLQNAPEDVREDCKKLLCNSYNRIEFLTVGEDHGERERDGRNEMGQYAYDPQMARQVISWGAKLKPALQGVIDRGGEGNREAGQQLLRLCGDVVRPFEFAQAKYDAMAGAQRALENVRPGAPLPEDVHEGLGISRAIFDYCDRDYTTGERLDHAQEDYQEFARSFAGLKRVLDDPDEGMSPDVLHELRQARSSLERLQASCREEGSIQAMTEHSDPNIRKMAEALISLTEKSTKLLEDTEQSLKERPRQIIPLRNTGLARMDGIDPGDLLPIARGKPIFAAFTSRKPDGSSAGVFEKNYIDALPPGRPVHEFYLRIGRGSVDTDSGGTVHRSKDDRLTVLAPQVDTSGAGKDRLVMINTGITRKDWDVYRNVVDGHARGERRFSSGDLEIAKRVQGQLVSGVSGERPPPYEFSPAGDSPMTRLSELVAQNKMPPDLAARLGRELTDSRLLLNPEGRERKEFMTHLITLCEKDRPGVAAALLERLDKVDTDLSAPGRDKNRDGELHAQRQDLYSFAKDGVAHPESYTLSLNTAPLTRLNLPQPLQ